LRRYLSRTDYLGRASRVIRAFLYTLACVVTAATTVFLVSALRIRCKFKDFLNGATLQFAIDNPTLARDKVLMVRRGAISEDAWQLAAYAVVFPVVIFLVWDGPSTGYEMAGFVLLAVAAIVVPWLVFWWSSGSVYVLSDMRMTRLSPMGREAHIEWRRVRSLDYNPMREVFLIGDGDERFVVDLMTKNWKYFFEYAKTGVPKGAWTDRARREMTNMQKAEKGVGAHMVRQPKGETPY